MPERGQRAGLELVSVAIENIKVLRAVARARAAVLRESAWACAYEDVSRCRRHLCPAAIAQGVRDNGTGDGGAMVLG